MDGRVSTGTCCLPKQRSWALHFFGYRGQRRQLPLQREEKTAATSNRSQRHVIDFQVEGNGARLAIQPLNSRNGNAAKV